MIPVGPMELKAHSKPRSKVPTEAFLTISLVTKALTSAADNNFSVKSHYVIEIGQKHDFNVVYHIFYRTN